MNGQVLHYLIHALILDLPALPGPNHNGGKLLISSDKNLYVVIGDLNHNGELQNINDGPDPDDTGVIFQITSPDTISASAVMNPFTSSQADDLLSRYYAYGIRNSLWSSDGCYDRTIVGD